MLHKRTASSSISPAHMVENKTSHHTNDAWPKDLEPMIRMGRYQSTSAQNKTIQDLEQEST